MANKELDTLLEGYFAPKEDVYGIEKLQTLIKEVYEVSMMSGLLSEREKKAVTRTYSISQVPMVPISELGWANNESGAEGGSQRKLLEDWLRPIGEAGGDFQSKLKAVTDKMEQGFSASDHGGSMRKYIQEVMSYLVFLKSLTMAITNFNASAAGFNFEAFLAVLMGGYQIPAGQKGEKSTIADFVAEMSEGTVPISLKLYTKGSLKVGGSFRDLCHDLTGQSGKFKMWASWAQAQPGGSAMRYLVCTKDFQEAVDAQGKKQGDLSRHGVINFYEFDINVDNLYEMFATASGKTARCIATDPNFMTRLSAWDKNQRQGDAPAVGTQAEDGTFTPLPDKASVGNAQQLALSTDPDSPGLLAYLNQLSGPELDMMGDKAAGLFQSVAQAYAAYVEENPNHAKAFWTPASNVDGPVLRYFGWDGNVETAKETMKAIKTEYGLSVAQIRGKLATGWNSFKNNVLKSADPRGQAIAAIDWQYPDKKAEASAQEIVKWYKSLSPEAKRVAILNTKGYLETEEWEIPDGAARSLGKGLIAELPIGAPHVQALLDKVQEKVMKEVFAIFDEMQTMSEKLNSYFANGLNEKSEAESGAAAGEEAAGKARDIAKDV